MKAFVSRSLLLMILSLVYGLVLPAPSMAAGTLIQPGKSVHILYPPAGVATDSRLDVFLETQEWSGGVHYWVPWGGMFGSDRETARSSPVKATLFLDGKPVKSVTGSTLHALHLTGLPPGKHRLEVRAADMKTVYDSLAFTVLQEPPLHFEPMKHLPTSWGEDGFRICGDGYSAKFKDDGSEHEIVLKRNGRVAHRWRWSDQEVRSWLENAFGGKRRIEPDSYSGYVSEPGNIVCFRDHVALPFAGGSGRPAME